MLSYETQCAPLLVAIVVLWQVCALTIWRCPHQSTHGVQPDCGLEGNHRCVAWLAAHHVAPELHQVLEKEFPFFDAPPDQSAADQSIHCRIRQLLEEHRDEIVQEDLDLATWIVLRTMESLIHAAVIPPGTPHPIKKTEQAILAILTFYLCGDSRRTT